MRLHVPPDGLDSERRYHHRSRDTGAAIDTARRLVEQPGEIVIAQKGSVLGEQPGARQVRGAGDMPGHRIHRFHLTAEAFGRARVEQDIRGRGLLRRQRRTRSGVQIGVRHRHVSRFRCDDAGLQGPRPSAQATIEDAHVGNARRRQHPPRPGRTGAVPVVVHHDWDALTHTPSPSGGLDTAS